MWQRPHYKPENPCPVYFDAKGAEIRCPRCADPSKGGKFMARGVRCGLPRPADAGVMGVWRCIACGEVWWT